MTVIDLANKQREEIAEADAKNLEAIADAYALMFDNLEGDIDALILAISKLENPTKQQIQALPQYKRLIRNAEEELDDFNVYLTTIIRTSSLAAISLGLKHSEDLVNFITGGGFTGLDSGVMRQLLEFLKRDGALYARLKELTGFTIDKVIEAILNGVSSGFNPVKIAELIQDAFGNGLTDALRNLRTVQIKSYQESARANYLASDVVQGWVWYADLEGDPCMSCISQHGSIHPLSETLDDHYNGRCAPIPFIEEFGNPVGQSGQEWFDSLSEAQQKALMGDSKWQAYQDGLFEFSQLSHAQESDVYGRMFTEASLKHLLEQ